METSECAKSVRLLEAFDDGELDAVTSFAVQQHLESCAHCRARHAWASEVRASLGRLRASEPAAAPALHARIHRDLARSRWRTLSATVAATAALVLAGFIGFTLWSRSHATVAMEFAHNHHESLARPDAVKFASNDPLAAETWLRERLPFAVEVPRRAPPGYHLAGARLCEVGGRTVGYLQYAARDRGTLSLFVGRRGEHHLAELAPVDGDDAAAVRRGECDGATVVTWDAGDVTYVGVGDLAEEPLLAFARQEGLPQ